MFCACSFIFTDPLHSEMICGKCWMRATIISATWKRLKPLQPPLKHLQQLARRPRRQPKAPQPIAARNVIMHHRKAPTTSRKHRKPISVIHFIIIIIKIISMDKQTARKIILRMWRKYHKLTLKHQRQHLPSPQSILSITASIACHKTRQHKSLIDNFISQQPHVLLTASNTTRRLRELICWRRRNSIQTAIAITRLHRAMKLRLISPSHRLTIPFSIFTSNKSAVKGRPRENLTLHLNSTQAQKNFFHVSSILIWTNLWPKIFMIEFHVRLTI